MLFIRYSNYLTVFEWSQKGFCLNISQLQLQLPILQIPKFHSLNEKRKNDSYNKHQTEQCDEKSNLCLGIRANNTAV